MYQQGGMIVFEGSRRQRGGNLFSTIKRVLIPLGKKLAPTLKSTGKDLARRGVSVGVGALRDKLSSKNVTMKDALRRRATHAMDKAVKHYLGDTDGPDTAFTSQDGAGLRRKRKRRPQSKSRGPAPKRRKVTVNRRPKKRTAGPKRLKSINKVKRRGGNVKRGKRQPSHHDIFS